MKKNEIIKIIKIDEKLLDKYLSEENNDEELIKKLSKKRKEFLLKTNNTLEEDINKLYQVMTFFYKLSLWN